MLSFFLAAVCYVWRICDPMPSADNWANLHVFVRKALYQGVGISDFLWKRGIGDHAQPLNKVLLWINTRYFGLDFKLEGLVAMAFGLAAALLLRYIALDGGKRAGRWASVGVVAVVAVFFSLNSSRIYSYSMAAMWFSLYLGMFASVIAAWRVMNGAKAAWLILIVFLFGVVADDVGYLAVASIILATCLYGRRTGAWRTVLRTAACCLAGLVLSRLFYALFQGGVGGAMQWQTSPANFIHLLQSDYRDAWQWWAIPAASGFAHVGTMTSLVGATNAAFAANVVAAILLPLHAWFWWKAWTRKPDLTGFMAVCVMLFYYAHVAGILYGRVPIFGTDYMQSIRYVSFYQLGVIALLLMFTAAAADAAERGLRMQWAYGLPLAATIVLEVAIAAIALAGSGRTMLYQEKKAYMLATMASVAPEAQRECMAFKEFRSLCVSEERREQLGALLAGNQLSVFSPQFQRRYPRLAAAVARADRAFPRNHASPDR